MVGISASIIHCRLPCCRNQPQIIRAGIKLPAEDAAYNEFLQTNYVYWFYWTQRGAAKELPKEVVRRSVGRSLSREEIESLYYYYFYPQMGRNEDDLLTPEIIQREGGSEKIRLKSGEFGIFHINTRAREEVQKESTRHHVIKIGPTMVLKAHTICTRSALVG